MNTNKLIIYVLFITMISCNKSNHDINLKNINIGDWNKSTIESIQICINDLSKWETSDSTITKFLSNR